MSRPTTRPCGARWARMRESHPAPQPTSRILLVSAICIRSRVGLAMGQCSCSIDSPLPSTAQRLNSSRRFSWDFDSAMRFYGDLDGTSAASAEAPIGLREAAAATAKFGAAHTGVSGVGVGGHGRDDARDARFSKNGPKQRHDPADKGPAEKKVEEKYRCKTLAMPGNKRRQE